MALVDLSTTPQRAIIIAAGEGQRWKTRRGDDYLGVPKHLVPVGDETLLAHTVRLLHENGVDDVWVIGPDDPRYDVDGATLYVPTLNQDCSGNCGADKFLSSEKLWLDHGRTITLYGDVYFTEQAMTTICTYNHCDWLLFARPYGSQITGCPWGECFAITFFDGQLEEHRRTLNTAIQLHHAGEIRHPSGWQHYRAMTGLPSEYWDRPWYGDRIVRIDDFTEDFDSPNDYKIWSARRAEAGLA